MKCIQNKIKQILKGFAPISFILLISGISLSAPLADLDEFDDLELESLDEKRKTIHKTVDSKKQFILFDDNLYLLDDDFDFGEDEYQLQKLEINQDDLETAKEYETFLNAFFSNSTSVGTIAPTSANKGYNNNPKDTGLRKKPSTGKAISRGNIPQFSPNRPKRGAMGFGVSSIIGATIPVTMQGFTASSNMGLRIDTPVSFNVVGLEAVTGIDGYISSMSVNDNVKYSMFNIIGNISIFPLQSIEKLQSIETRVGLGLNSMTYNNLSGMHPSFSFDINYYLPMNISGFKFAVNLHGQRTFGYEGPGSTTELGDATDFMYLGILINTPLAF